jgi:hypothetical protein
MLTFWHLFDNTKAVTEFALCFPYTYTRLQKYLATIERQYGGTIVSRSVLASTIVSGSFITFRFI